MVEGESRCAEVDMGRCHNAAVACTNDGELDRLESIACAPCQLHRPEECSGYCMWSWSRA